MWAQTPAPPAAPDAKPEAAAAAAASAAPAPAPEWSVGPITFSGMIDVYYSFNANHPASGTNNLRNFDVKANQFGLNMAMLTLEHTADPIGFHIDFGFGKTFEIIHATEKAPDALRYIKQGYITIKPPKGKGFQLDIGKFVTAAGAEVIETKDNWNYSRSILFAYAIPYYHFGIRTQMPVGKYFTGGVQLVNGWNNVEDNNSGKTLGLTSVVSGKKATWSTNYYAGPEKDNTNKGIRQLFDTTLLLNPSPKASFYINYDYGHEKNIGLGSVHWTGIAGAARFQVTDIFAISPRIEWFNDSAGFTTGAKQKIKEFTLTAEFKLKEGLLMRGEYRRDWSDTAYFDRGFRNGVYKNQDTLLAGFVAFFGPKR